MGNDVKSAFKNLTALGLVQVTNYLLPLLTIPYLIRVLGVENFGLISFAQAVLLYMVIVPDYGFNLTTTKQIAINRDNQSLLNSIISTTLVTKTFLLALSFLILVILLYSLPIFRHHQILLIYGFSIVMGQTYFPIWFFQGIERLKFITFLNLFSRLLFTLLVILIVKRPSDYVFVIPVYALGLVTSSIIGLMIMIFKFNFRFSFPRLNEVASDLKVGLPIFISSLANNTSINAGILLTGLFTTQTIVGYYAIADKVLLIFRQFMVVTAQALYPTLCRLRERDEQKIWRLIKSVSLPLLAGMGLATCFLFLLPSTITEILSGESIKTVSDVIRIFSPLPVIMLIGMVLNQILLAYEFKKESMFVSLFSAVLVIVLNIFTIKMFGVTGLATGVVIIESIAVLGYFYLCRNSYLLKKWRHVDSK